ncbi:MAG TPA: Imm1 family immunity protein [Flavobacteriales bacterium]|nr:Imm1 family immunity protein [Flavobacteriales bacterium]
METIRIHINNQAVILLSAAQLDSLIDSVLLRVYSEIWISGHGNTSLTVLVNADYAFFRYQRYDGDGGLRSVNHNHARNQYEIFILPNAQQDEYPANWLYNREIIRPVLQTYFEMGERYEGIDWDGE